jgi:hypothetical protein
MSNTILVKGKSKVVPTLYLTEHHATKTYWGNGGIAPPGHLMEVSGQLHAPTALPTGKEPLITHWIGSWVGSRVVLDSVMKRKIPSPRRESNPRTPIVQPIA